MTPAEILRAARAQAHERERLVKQRLARAARLDREAPALADCLWRSLSGAETRGTDVELEEEVPGKHLARKDKKR
jgi:hypothetical protein